jgi:hypothetical protein
MVRDIYGREYDHRDYIPMVRDIYDGGGDL